MYKEKNENFWQCLVIDHTHFLYRVFNAFYVFCTIGSSIMYGYHAVFREENEAHSQVMMFFELVYLLRIITQFFTTYENPYKRNDIVKDVELLARNYY
jgi:hypothetical protein